MKTDIKNLTEDLYDETIDMLDRAFKAATGDYFRRHQLGDPSYTYDQGRILLVEGRVVSHLQVFHRTMRYGAGRIEVGAIADVGTDPDHRRQGYADRLLRNSVQYMRENNQPLSLLYTGTPALYEKSGWIVVPATVLEADVPSEAKPGPRGYVIKPFEAEFFRVLASFYDKAMSNVVGPLDRSIEYFTSQPDWLSVGHVVRWDVIYKVGHPAGYVRTEVRDKTLTILDVCGTSDEVIRVACSQVARRAIDSGCEMIRGRMGSTSMFAQEFGDFADFRLVKSNSQMMRLNDLVGILQGALPEFHRRRRHNPLNQNPVAIKVGDATARLELPSGTARLATPRGDEPVLDLTEEQFLHLLMGLEGSLEPVTASDLSASTKLQLEGIFPENGHVFWEADAF